jgi:anaerobic selenocysteine-containing dehydrogenase
MFPLRKVAGDFRRVPWNTILDEIAERIKDVCDTYGPQSILYYQGFGERTALKLLNRRFFNLLGPVTFLKGTVCGGTGQASQDMDFGNRISHDFRDYVNSGALVVWGRNPAATNINLVPAIKDVRRRSGKVVVIDPLDTKTTAMADLHIRPRPGTDAFLALAVARIIIDKGAEDAEFLLNNCDNYQQYKKLVYEYDIKELSKRCDVSEATINELALIIMKNKPVGFLLGWGLHRWQYAHTSIRAIDALAAVAGSIGVSGGGVSQGFEEYLPYDWDVYGDGLNPQAKRLSMPRLAEELDNLEREGRPIQILFVTAGNPLVMLPDSNAVRKAFERIPFKVVMGHFLDDTAELADIFLPSTTFLEENDVVASYGHSYLSAVNQATQAPGQTKSDFQMFMELGSRFNFASEYVKPLDEWLKIILRPTLKQGFTLEQIRDGGFFQPDVPHVPYTDKRFPTATGNFQLMTSLDWYDSPDDLCCVDPTQPLPSGHYRLMSTAPFAWLCSETTPNQFKGTLPVTLATGEAERMGFVQGDICLATSPQGQIACQIVCSDTQRSDLVYIPRGGWGQRGRNVNVLTKAIESKVGCGTAYYETMVTLEKLR